MIWYGMIWYIMTLVHDIICYVIQRTTLRYDMVHAWDPPEGIPCSNENIWTVQYLNTTHIVLFKGFHLRGKSPQGDLKQETYRRHPVLITNNKHGINNANDNTNNTHDNNTTNMIIHLMMININNANTNDDNWLPYQDPNQIPTSEDFTIISPTIISTQNFNYAIVVGEIIVISLYRFHK